MKKTLKQQLAEKENEARTVEKRIENLIKNKKYCNCLQERLHRIEKEIEELRRSIVNRRVWKNGIFKTLFGGLKWKM